MAKSLKFTIEVNGLELNERAQAQISKALNETLMHQLGALDMTTGGATKEAPAKEASDAKASGSFWALKELINGGMLLKLASPELLNSFSQLQTKFNIPNAKGDFNVTLKQM